MSSSGKMVLFFLGATVFNVVLMLGLAAGFGVLILLILGPNSTIAMPMFFVGLIAAMVLTFLIYGKVMKWVTVKFDLPKHIPQLFKGRKK